MEELGHKPEWCPEGHRMLMRALERDLSLSEELVVGNCSWPRELKRKVERAFQQRVHCKKEQEVLHRHYWE